MGKLSLKKKKVGLINGNYYAWPQQGFLQWGTLPGLGYLSHLIQMKISSPQILSTNGLEGNSLTQGGSVAQKNSIFYFPS